MRKAPLYLSLLVSVIWMLVVAGCGGGSENNGTGAGSGTGGAGGAPGAGGSGGDCTFNCGTTSTGTGTSTQGVIILSPVDPTLTVDNGSIPSQPFTAVLNGNDVTGQVTWSFERPDIGDITAGSTFAPSGNVAGMGKLTARLNMSEGSTTVTVFIKKLVNTAGITPGEQSAFDTPSGADPSLSILYPYNETVFPLDVLAPEVQWSGGQAGDVYRLKITEKFYEYTEFFAAPPPSRHLIAEADWKSLQESGTGAQGDPVGVALSRRSGATIYEPAQHTWHVARGRLKGSVYYWELPPQVGCVNPNGNGRILRIKPDSPTVDEFFTPGGCWGCHTVSRDGKKMAAEFIGGNGPLYTLNLDANPVTYGDITAGNPAGDFIFSAFNHTGDKLLVSENDSRQLRIVDSVTGDTLNPNVLGNGCGEPAWSPDGTKIAAVCGMANGSWTFDSSTGNLVVADVQADGITVANTTTIVPQAGGTGRPAYPSFSPGGEWLTFGRPTSGSRSSGNGTLWMVRPDGQDLKQLTAAGSDNRSFNPVFAPLRAGGYFWIVFSTRRDYGNTLVNTSRQQLWITAVQDPPTAASDPSNPPFYLRAQELCGLSENAYYALDPCKAIGEGCLSGIDCCNGQCIKDQSTGQYVCGEPPPPGQCSENGNSCVVSTDCCDPSASCVDGFCAPPVPR